MQRSSAARATTVVAIAAMLVSDPTPATTRCRGKHWLATWSTSPSDGRGPALIDQSLRLIVNPTLGGTRVRVRLSNRFGPRAVTLAAVTIARRASGADLAPGTVRRLRFERRPSVTIPPGGEVVSDARRFAYEAFEDLVVSLHVSGTSGLSTEHATAVQTSYVAPPGSGDRTGDESGIAFAGTISSWLFLSDVEVRAPRRVRAVVALGDSITDGFPEPRNRNGRYPDLLARRLAAAGMRLAVQNQGISGNEVLREGVLPGFGPSLLARLDRDALDQAGASIVILMEGTNDVGVPPPPTAEHVVAGLRTVVERLRAAGLRVIIGTLPPCKDFALALHGTASAIAARNAINDWIRTSGVADAVIDFHAVLRDPDDPDRLRREFDSGDHLHPSPAGYAAMADAVDLALLADPPCR